MLTTANAEYDRKFRLWRQHGMSVPDTVRHGAREVIFESYPEVGFNYRMTDMQAAVGREQLKRLPEIVAGRRRDRRTLSAAALGRSRASRLPIEPAWARSNWQSYCVRLPDGSDQRAVMQAMLDAGISTRRGIMSTHTETAYVQQPLRTPLPVSEAATNGAIILPLSLELNDVQQQFIAERLAEACGRPASVVGPIGSYGR